MQQLESPSPSRASCEATRRCFTPTTLLHRVALVFALVLTLGGISPAFAVGARQADLMLALPSAHAAAAGEMIKDPDLGSEAELVRFDDELMPALLGLSRDKKVRIADWPVSPGARRDVLIARHEIYAPDARILEITPSGTREFPRSRLAFFWGVEADDPHSGVFVAIDPVAGTIESMTESGGVRYQLTSLVPGKPGLHLLATAQAFVDHATGGHKLHWTCGNENLLQVPQQQPAAAEVEREIQEVAPEDGGAITNGTPYNLMTVGVDTDNEFFSAKFPGVTAPYTAVTNYIAMMFAEINVMYERDLNTGILIGTTILRPTAASDPYTTPGSGAASPAQLTEFSNYWAANETSVSRTVAVMLSGKSSDPDEASGIAWYTGDTGPSPLCSRNYGYSFEQLFTFAANSSSLPGDTLILGHEIGHNFGTRHTHCYTPPIDMCYNLESGCYSGPISCPAPTTIAGVTNVEGTVMSYCQVGLLPSCTASQVFGPVVLAFIKPNLQAALGNNLATGQCIAASASVPAPSVSAIRPNSGSTGGNSAVTITGTNFLSGATVAIGGVAATSVLVVNDTTITAVTGAHGTGVVSVAVTSNGMAANLANSYFYTPAPAATSFYTVTPCRIVDTRNATGTYGGPSLAATSSRTFVAAGQCGIPTSAIAISANVTATIPSTAAGSFTLYPGNAFPLGTSNVSFAAGQTVAGQVIVTLASDGSGSFAVLNSASSTVNFVFDVNGYFQ
jgi:Metallo-peptidase family M12/IPT/TIG domain